MAANAIMMRLAPVAFAAVFALTGAVGPIFGQNLGARLYDRVRRTLTDGLIFTLPRGWWRGLCCSGAATAHLGLRRAGKTAELVSFFCAILGGSWMFHGALFVANSAFNNLGFPLLATAFNWGKATLGTIPFALARRATRRPGRRAAGAGRRRGAVRPGGRVGRLRAGRPAGAPGRAALPADAVAASVARRRLAMRIWRSLQPMRR